MPTTREAKTPNLDSSRRLLAMSLLTVCQQAQSVPETDFGDLMELLAEFRKAKSQEERDSIERAILEIIESPSLKVTAMRRLAVDKPGPKLQKWIDYISDRIKTLRTKAGLTQVELAERSGLTQSHISRIEAGMHSPTHHTLEKIAVGLGVSVGKLDPSQK
jgi:ribosome-binding protein aMBF1 (putative translation factor)